MTPTLSKEDQGLIVELNTAINTDNTLDPEGVVGVVHLLSIITRYQKALDVAVEQRDEFVDALGQFVNALKEVPASEEQLNAYNETQLAEYNEEIEKTLRGIK